MTLENLSRYIKTRKQDVEDCIYYGYSESGFPILLNRRHIRDGRVFFLGTPGSGVTTSIKQELLQVLSSTDDEVIVIDVDGEYTHLAKEYGGEVITVGLNSGCDSEEKIRLNPLILHNYYDISDTLCHKSDFIFSLIDTMSGSDWTLSPEQRSSLDRCVRVMYQDYFDFCDNETGNDKESKLPTLNDLYLKVKKLCSYDGCLLAEILRPFSNEVTVNKSPLFQNRFTVFDLQHIEFNNRIFAFLVVLEYVWAHILNSQKERRQEPKKDGWVWLYLDDIKGLFDFESSSEYVRMLLQRSRMVGCIPTLVTRDANAVLSNEIARTILSNTHLARFFPLEEKEAKEISDIFNLKERELEYPYDSKYGAGLFLIGSTVLTIAKVYMHGQLFD